MLSRGFIMAFLAQSLPNENVRNSDNSIKRLHHFHFRLWGLTSRGFRGRDCSNRSMALVRAARLRIKGSHCHWLWLAVVSLSRVKIVLSLRYFRSLRHLMVTCLDMNSLSGDSRCQLTRRRELLDALIPTRAYCFWSFLHRRGEAAFNIFIIRILDSIFDVLVRCDPLLTDLEETLRLQELLICSRGQALSRWNHHEASLVLVQTRLAHCLVLALSASSETPSLDKLRYIAVRSLGRVLNCVQLLD